MMKRWVLKARIFASLVQLLLNCQLPKEKLQLLLKSMRMASLMLKKKMIQIPKRSLIQHQSNCSASQVNLLKKITLKFSNTIKTPKNRKLRNLSSILVRSLLKMGLQSLKAVLKLYMKELQME